MKARLVIAFVITGVWAANYLAAIIEPSYTPPLEINGIMLLVAGYFFGEWIRIERKNGKRNGNG